MRSGFKRATSSKTFTVSWLGVSMRVISRSFNFRHKADSRSDEITTKVIQQRKKIYMYFHAE